MRRSAVLLLVALAGCGTITKTVTQREQTLASPVSTAKTSHSAPKKGRTVVNNPAQQPDPSVTAYCNTPRPGFGVGSRRSRRRDLRGVM